MTDRYMTKEAQEKRNAKTKKAIGNDYGKFVKERKKDMRDRIPAAPDGPVRKVLKGVARKLRGSK